MKTNFDRYNMVIITDEDGKPMAWADDQLCYCTNSDCQDEQHPVKVYTKQYAKRLIFKSQLYRKKNHFSVPIYKLMPAV